MNFGQFIDIEKDGLLQKAVVAGFGALQAAFGFLIEFDDQLQGVGGAVDNGPGQMGQAVQGQKVHDLGIDQIDAQPAGAVEQGEGERDGEAELGFAAAAHAGNEGGGLVVDQADRVLLQPFGGVGDGGDADQLIALGVELEPDRG